CHRSRRTPRSCYPRLLMPLPAPLPTRLPGPRAGALATMDAARRWALACVVRLPLLRPLATSREARMLARATCGTALAFTATLFAPGLLFVLGPVLFGVPHVAADIRYLVRRPKMPGGVAVFMYTGCAVFLALRALELAMPELLPFARIELALA